MLEFEFRGFRGMKIDFCVFWYIFEDLSSFKLGWLYHDIVNWVGYRRDFDIR